MIPYYGDFPEDYTKIKIPFNTFDSNDPTASVTVTTLVDADIKVHKDGGVTPIATDGATIVINLNSITGNHIITIDTSVHADYAAASEYSVRIEGATVDAGNINGWIGSFSIERAGGVLALIKAGTIKVDIETIKTQAVTAAAGVTVNPSVGAATIQPTNTQFEARSLLAAAYTIVSDLGTVQSADNNTILSNATYGNAALRTRGDIAWVSATGFATETKQDIMQGNVTDILADTNELQLNQGNWLTAVGFSTHSAADVLSAMQADNTDLDYLVTDLINRKDITILTGISEQFNDAGVSLGSIGSGYGDDGVTVSRPAQRIVKP